MNYYNEGSFMAKTMEDLAKLVAILNDADLSPYGYDPDDAYETDGKFCLEIGERYGDIEAQMDKVADKIIKANLDVDFEIHYFGDAEGAYVLQDGVYECLGESAYRLRQEDDKDLLKEIYRRGLNRRICNDDIRSFMQSELESQYGLYKNDAKRAAVMAFEYYVNTEDASQYDGIQWAAEHNDPHAWIQISKETLPEYWDDFAIVIAFPDGTNTLAQENHYTLHDCLHKLNDVKFFLDGIDAGGECGK